MANLDTLIKVAEHRYPSEVVNYVVINDGAPQVLVTMVPTLTADYK